LLRATSKLAHIFFLLQKKKKKNLQADPNQMNRLSLVLLLFAALAACSLGQEMASSPQRQ